MVLLVSPKGNVLYRCAMVDEGVKFDEIHLQTGDMAINWRRRRSAKCLLRLGFVEG